MLRLSPFLFYTLSIAAAFSGTAVNHVLAAVLSSVPTKSAFHKLSFFLVVKDASMSGVLNLILSPFVSYFSDGTLNFALSSHYYNTYENHQISAVDLHAEDLESNKLICYPVIQGERINYQNK